MLDIGLLDILDKTENIKLSREFRYIEQQAIEGSSSIVAGNESLRRYPLSLKLHSDFCNPQKIIDEIEIRGVNREVIQYFQGSKYIGAYVIENYNLNIVQKFDDAVIYAEVELTLLEDNIHDKVFQANEKKKVDLDDITSYEANSRSIQGIGSNQSALNSAFNNALNNCTSMLVGIEKELGQRLANKIVDEVRVVGATKLFEVTNKSLDGISLGVKTAVSEIPKLVLNSYLR